MPSRFPYDVNDPITVLLQPPPDETPQQRASRLAAEAEARRVSDEIDARLKQDRAEFKRRKKAVKVLLLGQAESGKSTTLKNFQIMYSSETWKKGRVNWRSVVQLNLIRSVLVILDLLSTELTPSSPSHSSPSSPYLSSPLALPSVDGSSPSRVPGRSTVASPPPLAFTDKHRTLKLRLAPLRSVEADLRVRLGAEEETAPGIHSPLSPPSPELPSGEATVRSWKGALYQTKSEPPDEPRVKKRSSKLQNGSDDVTDVLIGCRDDINTVWQDRTVRELLSQKQIRLEDSPGFFLNDVDRIADRNYVPSDEDVIRARLRTTGVQEHILTPEETGLPSKEDWIIYDVGGSRTQRQAWLPFFENTSAIIFLAPISCFNEHLAEDPSVNRLEDSILIWTAICSSSLLAESTIIVFLNKIDLLDRKLRHGVSFVKTLPAYGNQPNDMQHVTKFLRDRFKAIHYEKSPKTRTFYGFATSVVDIKATQKTLASIRDGIVLSNLKTADMIN